MSMQEGQSRFTEKTVADLKNGCNVTIVAFGDSITAGFAVRRGFPLFLAGNVAAEVSRSEA